MFAWMEDKRIVIGLILITSLALSFWSGSRVPQLNEKAAMGTEVSIDTLGFDTVLEIRPEHGVLTRILYTTVNWMDTNKKGMTFGVLFASALMTLFALFRRRSFNNSLGNSALGIAIGTPLGVCVNCAAPIAAGMAAAGTRMETTLATMISSPTLNVIVLTILFSLFPFYMVAIKVGFTLVFIIVLIPLLSRFVLKKEVQESIEKGEACAISDGVCEVDITDGSPLIGKSWWLSLKWVVTNYFKNFWFVFRTTVPLMALAGLLGSIAITFLPWEILSNLVPQDNYLTILLGMFLVAMIGIFLPVPISFDVIIAAILLAAGMPVKYVMVLLFTLGIYSVYSFFIVKQSVSLRAAAVVYVSLAMLGVAAGMTAHFGWKAELESNRQLALQYFIDSKDKPKPQHRTLVPTAQGEDRVSAAVPAYLKREIIPTSSTAVSVEKLEYRSTADNGKTPTTDFTKIDAESIGLNEPFDLSYYKLIMPLSLGYGRTISTGDVNNDGWIDVMLAVENGLALYINQGNLQFTKQNIDIPSLKESYIGVAVLMDMNNDAWLDVYFTTMAEGDYVLYNQAGVFNAEQLAKMPHYDDDIMTTTLGFADLDKDGDLDGVKGHWSIGWGHGNWLSSEKSRNFVLNNTAGQFELNELKNVPGVPIGLLISDYNNDDNLDLIIGNDFDTPDYFYLGDGKGGFSQINKDSETVSLSTHDTMSIVSADIDNDLSPEIFMGDVSLYPDNHEDFFNLPIIDVCQQIKNPDEKARCEEYAHIHETFFELDQRNDVSQCGKIKNERYRQECITFYFVRNPGKRGGQEICDLIPEHWREVQLLCQGNMNTAFVPDQEFVDSAIPQSPFRNVVLKANEEGKFVDHAAELELSLGGFTWNAKFVDFDNDEWQDLYVANGWIEVKKRRESNYFYRNREGKIFDNQTKTSGLESFFATTSYSHFDIDNDGDQDIITVPMNGPIQVFINNTGGNAIDIELRDEMGNSHGVGSKVFIYYGNSEDETGRHQMRELQASGGFLSYDPISAHFGLGEFDRVSRIEVVWSTGERDVIDGEFLAGARYRLERKGTAIVSSNQQ